MLVITSLAQQVRKQGVAISGYQVPITQVQTLYLTSAKIVRFLQIRLLLTKKRARYLQRSFQQGEQRERIVRVIILFYCHTDWKLLRNF